MPRKPSHEPFGWTTDPSVLRLTSNEVSGVVLPLRHRIAMGIIDNAQFVYHSSGSGGSESKKDEKPVSSRVLELAAPRTRKEKKPEQGEHDIIMARLHAAYERARNAPDMSEAAKSRLQALATPRKGTARAKVAPPAAASPPRSAAAAPNPSAGSDEVSEAAAES